MNWKLGLTRVYYVLWVLWALAWIYWSGLNLVHYGQSYRSVSNFDAVSGASLSPGETASTSLARARSGIRPAAKALVSGSIVFQRTGEPRWYFNPRPSTGQLMMLSMIGAALPGALLLAGRWIVAGFRREA
jgi:hypothetical protein